MQKNFPTEDAAVKWVQEYAKERTKPGKIRFMPPQLANVRRTGADYRTGGKSPDRIILTVLVSEEGNTEYG